MAKSSKKKNKPKKMSDENSKELRHLGVLLKYTVRCIDGRSGPLDDLFKEQSQKLQNKIDKLEGKQ